MNSLLTRIVLAATLLTPTFISQAEVDNYRLLLQRTDRVIVHFKEKPTEARALAFIKQGVTHGGYGVAAGKRQEVLSIGATVNLDDAKTLAAGLEDDPQVKFAEPDLVMQAMRVPNDPLYNQQWHYFETGAGINLPAAWDISIGSTDNVIGVIDTGITDHREINDRLVAGYDFVSDPWMANDGDGWDSNPRDPGDALQPGACGSSFGDPVPANARKSSWHGTHVTGTIAATTNDSIGVSGVTWLSRVQTLRALGRCGGYTSDIVSAMRWGAGLKVYGLPTNPNPVNVLNLSLGGEALWCPQTYQDAIDEVVAAGVTVVVAAGNEQQNVAMSTPANCKNVIVVGAINRTGNRSWYSNYGTEIDIMAPGGETLFQGNGILSLYNSGLNGPTSGSYAELQGTSMAAPHIAGLIDLSYAVNPTLSPSERERLLKETARPFASDSDCSTFRCGSGIADAAAFLRAIQKAK
ncbi:S8 family peptidase [Thalassotalea sp. G20_0]|uniref:S8 family peptidase n=1 Tax=Thalassotalea sp. G20_0 TaxID=2821093 RepID=UPI001ADA6009|nr:S8 family peptidase [Thalassotalea sp. G20_0]MBO9496364.1 S8 family peptidase [Thalassotalea sp. G20_0]